MPSMSGAARIRSHSCPARRLHHARRKLEDGDKSDQVTTACQETTRPDDYIEFICFASHQFFQSVWMQPDTDVSTPKGVDIIQGQHAHTKQHIQHGLTFMLGYEQMAVRWYPYGLYIRAAVLPTQKGVRGNVLAMGCAR